jgi:hypothetical protein
MMFGWLRPPVVRRYAYAFCGGVATGVLAYALLFHATPPSPVAPSDASATIVLKEPDRSLEGGTSYAVSSDHLKGTLTTNQLNDLQVLRVRLQSDQAVVTEITFDQTQLSVDAVRRLHGSPESVLIRNGAVEIHGSGDTAWSLFFSERTRTISPIRVVIRSSSEVLFEKLIPLSVSAPG